MKQDGSANNAENQSQNPDISGESHQQDAPARTGQNMTDQINSDQQHTHQDQLPTSQDPEFQATLKFLEDSHCDDVPESEQAAYEELQLLSKLLNLWQLQMPVAARFEEMRAKISANQDNPAEFVEAGDGIEHGAVEHEQDATDLAPLLDLSPVPAPDPKRWAGFKARVLEKTVHGGDHELNAPASRNLGLVMVAVSALLLVLVYAGFQGFAKHELTPQEVATFRQNVSESISQRKWSNAERDLEQLLQSLSSASAYDEVRRSSFRELQALRSFQQLPAEGEPRQAGLGSFLYLFPDTEMTAVALNDYLKLAQTKSSESASVSLDNMDKLSGAHSGVVVADNNRRRKFLAIIKTCPDSRLVDAAKVQLARLEWESGQVEEARKWLQSIHGEGPVRARAQELLDQMAQAMKQ